MTDATTPVDTTATTAQAATPTTDAAVAATPAQAATPVVDTAAVQAQAAAVAAEQLAAEQAAAAAAATAATQAAAAAAAEAKAAADKAAADKAAADAAAKASAAVLKTTPAAAMATSGTLAESTSGAVGTVAKTTPVVSAVPFTGTALAGLGAEKFTPEAQALFAQILATGSQVAKLTLSDVLRYVQVMGPSSPQNTKTGSAEQVALYTALVNSINNAGNDFQLMWAIILRVVFETQENGAFNDRMCFRFFPDMPLDTSARTAFRNLLSIMTSTANTSGRATALAQIDFQKALGKQFTDTGKNRLLGFYTV